MPGLPPPHGCVWGCACCVVYTVLTYNLPIFHISPTTRIPPHPTSCRAEVQRRAAPVILAGDDCILQSETGSGKTLAFLLPLLSLLRYPPHTYPDDLKARAVPPAVPCRVQCMAACLTHQLPLNRLLLDAAAVLAAPPPHCAVRAVRRSAPQGPAALVVVPTRELGVQAVMLVYRLFGGSLTLGIPGQGGNMFDYHGPRGLKVRCGAGRGGAAALLLLLLRVLRSCATGRRRQAFTPFRKLTALRCVGLPDLAPCAGPRPAPRQRGGDRQEGAVP